MTYAKTSLLTKEEFLDYLRFIKERSDDQLNFCVALDRLSPGTYNDAFLYSSYETKLVELLGAMVGDESDLIGYYLYDRGAMGHDQEEFEKDIEELWDELTKGESND